MVSRRSVLAGVLGAGALLSMPAWADSPVPSLGNARGQARIRGKLVKWRSETGEMVMRNAAGEARATTFAVTYLREGTGKKRPVTFIWNGGPGGSTWHLREHLSPRITQASDRAPGYAFVDNVNSIIDASDLVFIDAPGTGFSRILTPDAKREYWGVEEDGRAFSDFILQWLRDHGRLNSPVFMIAESYGGIRAGQVVRNLADASVDTSGIILVSPALSPLGGEHNWYTSYSPAIYLPSMAAVAHYHGKGVHVGASVDAVTRDALAFANDHYASALERVASLTATERTALAETLSGYVGLPAQEIADKNFLIPMDYYLPRLLADRQQVLEIGDGRGTRPAPPPGQQLSVLTPDSSFDRTASIEALVRQDLGYPAVGAYARDPMEISRTWNQNITREARTHLILADLMKSNKRLQILHVAGYFDLITPFAATQKPLHDALPAARFRSRIYPSGHAVYEDIALQPKTSGDLVHFYAKATA